jgi:hypothetical protein
MPGKNPECFVIMPFGKAPKAKFDSQAVYDKIIKPAVKKAFGRPDLVLRLDKRFVNGPLTDAIKKKLKSADVVIADLSGNNFNVMFELGFRHAQEKPFVCISNNPKSAGFWPKAFQITDYTNADAVTLIASEIREAYRVIRKRLEPEQQLAELTSKVRQEEAFTNPYQNRVAAWRIKRAWEQVDEIQKRKWEFDAHSPTAYVAYMFVGIMKLLDREDEYCTVTNMNFWSEKAVGEHAFLESNLHAVGRGVTVKRVFLIDKKVWNRGAHRGKWEAVLREHLRASNQAEKVAPDKMMVKCILSDNFDKDLNERYRHFGLARHIINPADDTDDGSLLIVPSYDRKGNISALKLNFSESSDRESTDYLKKFNNAFERGEDLQDFLRRA